jgi:hypothetical protein
MIAKATTRIITNDQAFNAKNIDSDNFDFDNVDFENLELIKMSEIHL